MTATFVPGPTHLETASGRYVDLVAPVPESICVEDIAHALANTCRYGGQSTRFFSVAEHACIVADRLSVQGRSPRVVLAGLHHDDAEAYLVDIPRPLKHLIVGYRELEGRMATVIDIALGLPGGAVIAATDIVKSADDWALSLEAYHLMPSRGAGWFSEGLFDPDRDGDDWPIGMSPRVAEAAYLQRHRALVAQTPPAAAGLDRTQPARRTDVR